jgi:hypothetical protein
MEFISHSPVYKGKTVKHHNSLQGNFAIHQSSLPLLSFIFPDSNTEILYKYQAPFPDCFRRNLCYMRSQLISEPLLRNISRSNTIFKSSMFYIEI